MTLITIDWERGEYGCTECGLVRVPEDHNCGNERALAKEHRRLADAVANLPVMGPGDNRIEVSSIAADSDDGELVTNAVNVTGDVAVEAVALDFDEPVSTLELDLQTAERLAMAILFIVGGMPRAVAELNRVREADAHDFDEELATAKGTDGDAD